MPNVIWFHNACDLKNYPPQSLVTALQSPVVTHVMLLASSPWDVPLIKTHYDMVRTIQLKGKKAIWARCCYSLEINPPTLSDIQEPAYWRQFLRTLRAEQQVLGAHCSCVDGEGYAVGMKLLSKRQLRMQDSEIIRTAVAHAVAHEGKADFFLPACSKPFWLYNATQDSGVRIIDEDTYWDDGRNSTRYEVFGAMVGPEASMPNAPAKMRILKDLFGPRRKEWADKDLFIYPWELAVMAVAEQLKAITEIPA